MKRKKTLIITVLCGIVLLMSVAFAVFSAQININGTTAVTSTWKVEFTKIITTSLVGGATNVKEPTFTSSTANFNLDLVLPGDKAIYTLTIKNYGDITAEVKGASINISGTEKVYVNFNGLSKGDLLLAGEEKSFQIEVGYDPNVENDLDKESKNISIVLSVGQYVESNPTAPGPIEIDPIPSYVTNEACFAFDEKGMITGYYDSEGNDNNKPECPRALIIPSTIRGVSVTTIRSLGGNGLTSVIIPPSVVQLYAGAFANNNLTRVSIPSSIKVISNSAFNNNQLTSVVIPPGVTTLSSDAFGSNNLTSVVIPSTVTTIGLRAFLNNQLTNVVIPSSVTSIADNAFSNNELTSVTIKGKKSSSDFSGYGIGIWGWASGYSESNIVWNG